MVYILAIDVGIGSVGWAVIRCEKNVKINNRFYDIKRIEDWTIVNKVDNKKRKNNLPGSSVRTLAGDWGG